MPMFFLVDTSHIHRKLSYSRIGSLSVHFMVVMLVLLSEVALGQISRISQLYPQAATTTPQTFTGPAYNGFYMGDYTTFFHAEYLTTLPYIRALRKDGSVVMTLDKASSNAQDLVRVGDNLISFGATLDIRLLTLLYGYPNFFILTSSNWANHNKNFKYTLNESNSSNIYVTTSVSGYIYKFTLPTLTAAASQSSFSAYGTSSIDCILFISDTTLMIGGVSASLTTFDKTSLAQVTSYSGSTNTIKVLKDKLAFVPTIDLAENTGKRIVRYLINSTTSTLTMMLSKTYTANIDNIIEFNQVNYLLVTSGANMEIVKRTTYLAVDSFVLNGVFPITSIACCEENVFKYTMSAPLMQTTPTVQTIFSTYQVNVDYCNVYSGTICAECYQGYKLDSLTAGNKCVTEDEYPPQYGAKGSVIAPCTDVNCLVCIKQNSKCEVCPSGLFINQANFTCSDLSNTPQFGRDVNNASIIRKCSDPECLDCSADYTKCNRCPTEYFMLVNSMCERKNANLQVVNQWFDPVASKIYIKFSDKITLDVADLYPQNLTVEFTDQYDEPFTDFTNLNVSMNKDKDTMIISLEFLRSVYGTKVMITQLGEKSLLYSPTSYMNINQQLEVNDIRQIKNSTYFNLQGREDSIRLLVWTVMILSILFGTLANPWYGSLVMRMVSVCNVFSHLNGPLLHVSDLFFDIVGETSLPLPIDSLFRGNGPEKCIPAPNFRRRYQGFSSCELTSLYGKSLAFFVVIACISVPISLVTYMKKKQHEKKLKEECYTGDKSFAKWTILDRFFGLRFLIIIMDASSAIVIQYSLLSVATSGTPITGALFAFVVLGLYLLLHYCLFQFIYNYLDLQYLKYLKLDQGVQAAHNPASEPDFFNLKNMNKILPKKGQNMIFKDYRINPQNFKEDRPVIKAQFQNELGSKVSENGLNQNSSQKSNLEAEDLLVDYRRVIYPLLHFFIYNYKKSPKIPRPFFYYLPLLELVNVSVSSFILVRFSDDGMTQVYIIAAFEFLFLVLTVSLKPFEQTRDLIFICFYKLVVSFIFVLRLVNFANLDEEATRQNKLDQLLYLAGVVLVVYTLVLGLVYSGIGIKILFTWHSLVSAELTQLESDKKEHLDLTLNISVLKGIREQEESASPGIRIKRLPKGKLTVGAQHFKPELEGSMPIDDSKDNLNQGSNINNTQKPNLTDKFSKTNIQTQNLDINLKNLKNTNILNDEGTDKSKKEMAKDIVTHSKTEANLHPKSHFANSKNISRRPISPPKESKRIVPTVLQEPSKKTDRLAAQVMTLNNNADEVAGSHHLN